jgi:hypothetical protein
MLPRKAETSVWAVAILGFPHGADAAVRTVISALADLPAGRVGNAGVAYIAVPGGVAGHAIPPVSVGEIADGTAMLCSRVRGNQQANPVGWTAGSGNRITTRPIHSALVVGRIAHGHGPACRGERAMATIHVGTIRGSDAKAETIGEVVTDGGREADVPRGAIIVLSRKASGIQPTLLKNRFLPFAGAGGLLPDAIKGIGTLFGAPIAAPGLADRIAASRRGGRADQGDRGTNHACLWPGACVPATPSALCVPRVRDLPAAPGAPRVRPPPGAPSAPGRDALKTGLRAGNARHQQNREPTRQQVSRNISHEPVVRSDASLGETKMLGEPILDARWEQSCTHETAIYKFAVRCVVSPGVTPAPARVHSRRPCPARSPSAPSTSPTVTRPAVRTHADFSPALRLLLRPGTRQAARA